LSDKSTGFSEWVTGTPKRAQDKLLAGAYCEGWCLNCAWDGWFLESLPL
jgi:hypothetical protein